MRRIYPLRVELQVLDIAHVSAIIARFFARNPSAHMSRDYKPTVFLPTTDFPMRANLPQREPEILARWEKIGLYATLRADAKTRPLFVLHDGPPYANGNIHIGHALNKILKDLITRAAQMRGFNADYVPGWDCHGLPIEWKIEEQYRAAGKDKDQVPPVEFRRECRAFAEKWVGIQREEFKRLGIIGHWEDPYLTMSYPAEAQIVREIGKFLMNGGLYRGLRPVMWSVVEKTALADAEVEYHDHKSIAIHVRFPLVTVSRPELAGAAAVIWTTTPWTIPANRAIAYGAEITYLVIAVTEAGDGAAVKPGDKLLVAAERLAEFIAAAKITAHAEITRLTGAELAGSVAAHPWRGQGYEFDVPLLAGDFVTTDAGTGLVHCAPSHGADDFELGRAHGIPADDTVAADGRYTHFVPGLEGAAVFTQDGKPGDANGKVLKWLIEVGALLAKASLLHSYPHSWRSKAPLIFRATPQWFISMRTNDLRDKALAAISATRWVPAAGENRIRAMIEQRPDWCISRQRAWGVPIAVFVNKKTGDLLRDQAVIERIAAAFEAEGADAWWSRPAADFLGPDYEAADWDQVFDVVDVWFDSGSTHAFVLERRPELKWPADLYLEGSDQHRGWFHSSLLESCGTRGRAPYDAVLTHGFTLDEQGRKMSKSLGNTTAPQDVLKTYGADILRLWVVGSDYAEDQRIGPEILKYQADLYRRLRNTLRYLLGAVAGWTPAEEIPHAELPELERWVLHRLVELQETIRQGMDDYDFHAVYKAIHDFCAAELSAFYFDVRKDSLYCDRPDSVRRRAARTVMRILLDALTKWLAPVLVFTCEEAWAARPMASGAEDDSVHRQLFPDLPDAWRDGDLAAKWEVIRTVRRVVTGALEIERADKRIGSALQAAPCVHVTADQLAAFAGVDPAEIFLTSAATLTTDPAPDGAFTVAGIAGCAVVPTLAAGQRCERCWQVLPEVGSGAAPDLCRRCDDAVAAMDAEARP